MGLPGPLSAPRPRTPDPPLKKVLKRSLCPTHSHHSYRHTSGQHNEPQPQPTAAPVIRCPISGPLSRRIPPTLPPSSCSVPNPPGDRSVFPPGQEGEVVVHGGCGLFKPLPQPLVAKVQEKGFVMVWISVSPPPPRCRFPPPPTVDAWPDFANPILHQKRGPLS